MFPKAKWIHQLFHLHARVASCWGGELFLLRLRPTLKCQLRCPFCYTKHESLEGNLLQKHEWKEIISKLPKKTVIDLTGGEPLLAPEIKSIILSLLLSKKKVSLMTNGLNLDDEFLKMLITQGLYSLLVSIDGPRHIHDSLRGEGNFQKVLERLDRLEEIKKIRKSSGPKLTLKINLLKENLPLLKDFILELETRYPKAQISLNLLFSNEARGGRRLSSSWEDERFHKGNTHQYHFQKEEQEAVLSLNSFLKKRGWEHFWRPFFKNENRAQGLQAYLENPASLGPDRCFLPYNSLTLYGNGDISPCDLSLKVGDIREYQYDLKRVFKDSRFQEKLSEFYQKNLQKSACQGCCLAPQRLNTRT